jgi:hypothetical protein
MIVPRSLALAALLGGSLLAALAAPEPEYPHGTFTADCATCHAGDTWSPVRVSRSFEHPRAFPLRGAHATTACRTCHLSLDFSKTPTACADCHRDVHRGELGTDCARCHVPVNFLDRRRQLEDHRATRFPLLGAHAVLDCESCHRPQPQGALTWVGLSIDCQACHLAEYRATTDPDHEAAGFPLDCHACHTPASWQSARFDHAGTAFPLTGAHRALDCPACHATGYAGTPTDCYACHQEDYAGTADPDHESSGFPTTCDDCHSTSSWEAAEFPDHDANYFPIYSGRHRGEWDRCTDCHTNPGSFATYSCFLCHDEQEMAQEHEDEPGYSSDCVQCHRDGDER